MGCDRQQSGAIGFSRVNRGLYKVDVSRVRAKIPSLQRRGLCAAKREPERAKPQLKAQMGWSLTKYVGVSDHPVRSTNVASRIHLVSRPPLLFKEGIRLLQFSD